MRARVVSKSSSILLDLDEHLAVAAVLRGKESLAHQREHGRIRIRGIKELQEPGAAFELSVAYSGVPREAPNAPWDGGFTWKKTPSGAPWIATTCQGEGADIWWPCKDQPGDEPDTMDIAIEVPERSSADSPSTVIQATSSRFALPRVIPGTR